MSGVLAASLAALVAAVVSLLVDIYVDEKERQTRLIEEDTQRILASIREAREKRVS